MTAPLHAQQPWRLEPDIRYEVDAENAPLSGIFQFVVGPDGSSYVVDYQARDRVYVFDQEGRYRHTIGRGGGGPGEFTSIARIGFRGDTLWISDGWQRRYTLFDAAHEVVRTVPFRETRSSSGLILSPYDVFADGTLHIMGLEPWSTPGGTSPVRVLLRYDPAGTLLDTLAVTSFRNSQLHIPLPGGEGRARVSLEPWAERDHYDLSASGRRVVIARFPGAVDGDSAAYHLIALSYDGTIAFSREVPYEPARLDDDAFAEVVDELMSPSFIDEFPSRDAARRAYLEAVYRPDFLPPVYGILAAMDGSAWVLRRPEYEVPQLEVFDSAGRFVATVELPEGSDLLEASADHVWATRDDAYGVPIITRYRIVR